MVSSLFLTLSQLILLKCHWKVENCELVFAHLFTMLCKQHPIKCRIRNLKLKKEFLFQGPCLVFCFSDADIVIGIRIKEINSQVRKIKLQGVFCAVALYTLQPQTHKSGK